MRHHALLKKAVLATSLLLALGMNAVPADLHDDFNKTLDDLFLALFPRQALTKRIDDGLSERFTGPLRHRSSEPVCFGVLDTEWHIGFLGS